MINNPEILKALDVTMPVDEVWLAQLIESMVALTKETIINAEVSAYSQDTIILAKSILQSIKNNKPHYVHSFPIIDYSTNYC